MESIGHMFVCAQRMLRLKPRIRREARAVGPIVQKVDVVGRRLALAKAEHVNECYGERHACCREGTAEADAHRAEQKQQRDHEREDAAHDIPEQIAVESPGAPGGIVRAVRLRESQLVVFHWNAPTSTVEPPRPNAVKSAFTITGAPAMMSPPMIESLPASVSPRRIAKPPPTTQIVPKIN